MNNFVLCWFSFRLLLVGILRLSYNVYFILMLFCRHLDFNAVYKKYHTDLYFSQNYGQLLLLLRVSNITGLNSRDIIQHSYHLYSNCRLSKFISNLGKNVSRISSIVHIINWLIIDRLIGLKVWQTLRSIL